MQTDRKTANEDEGDEMEKVRGSNKAEWRQCEGETFRNIYQIKLVMQGSGRCFGCARWHALNNRTF